MICDIFSDPYKQDDSITPIRAAWIDVNLDSIIHNAKEIQALVAKDKGHPIPVMPIIKGNAYGHGIYEVGKALYENGFNWLGVAIYSEAILVRAAAPNANILILGYTPACQLRDVIQNKIIQTVFTWEQAEKISQVATALNQTARIHIKLDTGMHRIGFTPTDESADAIVRITQLPNLYVEGIFTHFATSTMLDKSYVHKQFASFQSFMQKLTCRNVVIPIKHISNTGIILDNPEMNQDMVRFGCTTFGTYPSNVHIEKISLQCAFALRARIVSIKDLAIGEGVSYDLTFVAERPSKIATLPLGYADINIRKLRNKGFVLIHGKRAPIIGCVCMDQMVVDITDIDYVKIGDIATLIGRDGREEITLKEDSALLGLDDYELIISAQHRLPIRYWKNGEIYRLLDVNMVLYKYYLSLSHTELKQHLSE